MEGCRKIKQPNLCNEVDAESQNHLKEVGSLGDELKEFTTKVKKSIFGKYLLLLSKQGKSVFGYGLLQ